MHQRYCYFAPNLINMRIAVNARFLLHDKMEGVGIVTDEVMKHMVRQHPEHEYDYYFDRKFHPRFIHSPQVHPHRFAPVTRLPFLLRWWLNHPVRNHILKNKVDVFFSPDGFVPFNLNVPKVGMIHDVAYLHYPQYLQKRIRRFYDRWMPRYLQETDHIITVSEFSKKEIIEGYKIAPEKITVVYNGITGSYKPISDQQKQHIRQQYTRGLPYFLYLGAIHPRKNVLTLVRAFEHFKSTQPSDFQLILAGRNAWHTEDVLEAVQASRFKKDIHLPGYIPTDAATFLVGAAEAMIYPSLYEGFGLPLVEAMACGVPVICSNVSSLPEVAGNAALLFSPMDYEALSDQLVSLTQDAELKRILIQSGFDRAGYFSWDKAAREIYEVLQRSVEAKQK